jgi:hypothetical protein
LESVTEVLWQAHRQPSLLNRTGDVAARVDPFAASPDRTTSACGWRCTRRLRERSVGVQVTKGPDLSAVVHELAVDVEHETDRRIRLAELHFREVAAFAVTEWFPETGLAGVA